MVSDINKIVSDSLKEHNKKISKKSSIEIIDEENAKFVDLSKIKSKKSKKGPQKNIFNWGIKDLSLYIRDKFYEKYKKDWGHTILGATTEIGRIKDMILEYSDFCDYLMTKDYIDYIFNNEIDYIINHNGKGVFYLKNLRDEYYIKKFLSNYNYKSSFEKELNKKDKKDKDANKNNMSIIDIEQVYLLSEEEFVKQYGVIICIFWLQRFRNVGKNDSVKTIFKICEKIYEKGGIKKVIESTEKYSPYSKDVYYSKIDLFFEKINKDLKINIEYINDIDIDKKFLFLKGKKK